jgi:hypothetical protein
LQRLWDQSRVEVVYGSINRGDIYEKDRAVAACFICLSAAAQASGNPFAGVSAISGATILTGTGGIVCNAGIIIPTGYAENATSVISHPIGGA